MNFENYKTLMKEIGKDEKQTSKQTNQEKCFRLVYWKTQCC